MAANGPRKEMSMSFESFFKGYYYRRLRMNLLYQVTGGTFTGITK